MIAGCPYALRSERQHAIYTVTPTWEHGKGDSNAVKGKRERGKIGCHLPSVRALHNHASV